MPMPMSIYIYWPGGTFGRGVTDHSPSGISHYDSRETKTGLRVHRVRFTCVNTYPPPLHPPTTHTKLLTAHR